MTSISARIVARDLSHPLECPRPSLRFFPGAGPSRSPVASFSPHPRTPSPWPAHSARGATKRSPRPLCAAHARRSQPRHRRSCPTRTTRDAIITADPTTRLADHLALVLSPLGVAIPVPHLTRRPVRVPPVPHADWFGAPVLSSRRMWSRGSDLNRRPPLYESDALPLSYLGETGAQSTCGAFHVKELPTSQAAES